MAYARITGQFITKYQLMKNFQSLKEVFLNYFQIMAIENCAQMGAKASNTRNDANSERNAFRLNRILPRTSF
ncbi:hypothetical protein LAZ67_14000785 [Cordylochernes scorpioides]|uniref:Uncharacterized protein n=1 Tax=Cordylochernes scorpioides TaxID=51811 RepID=A0ABY6L5S3_9ARAC|nr:hypothetical protein LAZ67_14000785 [Cordylochernes scorpioides]